MAKKQQLVEKVIPFIREEGSRGVTTIAIVKCRADQEATSASIVEALKDLLEDSHIRVELRVETFGDMERFEDVPNLCHVNITRTLIERIAQLMEASSRRSVVRVTVVWNVSKHSQIQSREFGASSVHRC